jgi:hypothetical protein
MRAQNKNKINNKKEKGESREKFDESYKWQVWERKKGKHRVNVTDDEFMMDACKQEQRNFTDTKSKACFVLLIYMNNCLIID